MKYLILLVSLLAPSLHAQAPADNPGISCEFLCFERGAEAAEEIFAKGPGGDPLVKVTLSTISGVSPVPLFPTDGNIPFYKSPDATSAPLAVAALPKGATKVLIIFFPNPGQASPAYRTIVFDMNSNTFPEGGCAILNVNDKDVRFKIGEHQIQLIPGKIVSVARPSKRDEFNMSLTTFQAQNGEVWQTIYETMDHFPSDQRKLYVIYTDSKVHRARARSYNL